MVSTENDATENGETNISTVYRQLIQNMNDEFSAFQVFQGNDCGMATDICQMHPSNSWMNAVLGLMVMSLPRSGDLFDQL